MADKKSMHARVVGIISYIHVVYPYCFSLKYMYHYLKSSWDVLCCFLYLFWTHALTHTHTHTFTHMTTVQAVTSHTFITSSKSIYM